MEKNTIQVKIEISKRIFCFYALLNALGYDPESFSVNPVRQKVRDFLKHTLAKSETELVGIKNLIKEPNISKEYYFPLRTWVLCHGEPPTLKELTPYWKKFLDAKTGKQFCQWLNCFYKIGQVEIIWKTTRNDYQKIEKQCYAAAKGAVDMSLDYFRFKNKEIGFKEFIIIPNFLEEYGRGIGPKINDTAYAILGPSNTEDIFPIQRIEHEFLHSLINPITKEVFDDQIPWSQLSHIRESLIRAIVLRLNKSNKNYYQKKLERLKESEYKDIDKTIEFLERYEKQQKDFKAFFVQNNSNDEK